MMRTVKDTPPLVSVIVPTYNRAYCLGRAIQSVLDQTYSWWELIIVDNHSTDKTDAVVASFNDSRIRLLKIHNRGVIAASRNSGILVAQGDFVAFLDSDDWWLPEKLRVSVDKLMMGAALVYHDLYCVSSVSGRLQSRKLLKTRQLEAPVFQDLLFNGNAINTSSVVVRLDLLNQIGGFSEDTALVAAEDYEAWLRVAMQTNAFTRIIEPLGFYWVGGDSSSAPARTIQNLEKLLNLYANEFADNHEGPVPGWLAYSLARAYYLERKFDRVPEYVTIAVTRTKSWIIKYKAIVTLLLSSARLRWGGK